MLLYTDNAKITMSNFNLMVSNNRRNMLTTKYTCALPLDLV